MEIKLNVDGAHLSKEVNEIIVNLSDSEKESLALQVLSQVVQETETAFTTRMGVAKALEILNEKRKKSGGGKLSWSPAKGLNTGGSYYGGPSRDESEEFKNLTGFYNSGVAFFRQVIIDEMLKYAMKHVEQKVKNSKIIKQTIEKAVEDIESYVPEMVKNSMTQLFFSTLHDAMNVKRTLEYAVQDNQEQIRMLREKIDP